MAKRKNIKLEDIAKKAGVSVTTVSRVLNNTLKVKPEIERSIKEAAVELGYIKKIVSSKKGDETSSYYRMLIQNIRIRSSDENPAIANDFEPFIWQKDIKKLEHSLLWSPSNIRARAAFITSGMTHPYWVHQWAMLQKTRDKYFPNIELKLFDAQLDNTKMINNMKSAITEGYDAIIVSNHLGSAAYPGYKAVNNAKIPMIIYTTGAPCDVYSMTYGDYEYVTVVRGDEVNMGEKLAVYFGIKLKGKGNIVIVQGMAESTDNLSRRLGLQNEFNFWPGIKIIADVKAYWRPDSGYKVMKELLEKYPEPGSINGVISICDEQTVGVVEAIREKNRRNEIIIGSFDAALTGLIMIRNGDLNASVRYESQMEGVLVFDSMTKALKGEKVPKFRRQITPLVTIDNYKQFLSDPTTVIWEKTPERELPWNKIEEYMEE